MRSMKRAMVFFGLMVFGVSGAPDGGLEIDVPSASAARNKNAAAAAVTPDEAAASSAQQGDAQRLVELRTKVLKDEDFVESEQNRDPFRSFLALFQDSKVVETRMVQPAIFDKFALEELRLIAVVSGTPKPLAMFRDPGGLGQVIKRGDYISKSAARVSKILGDRVVLELTEVMGTGESRAIEKAILVNPEAVGQ